MKDISLYIHIPFCKSKCYYCDFVSFCEEDEKIDKYIDALLTELKLYREKLSNYRIKTIFIGGGTPSSIDENYIKRILDYINKNYKTKNLVEVSIEANPGTFNPKKMETYRDAGINRVSLGVQTLDDDILKSIGRIHDRKDFYKSLECAREMGIRNINADLIFGLPGQNLNHVMDSLSEMLELKIPHISYYGLILEKDTLLYDLYQKNKVSFPTEAEEREMYHNIVRFLKENGYKHYEISNFALEGYECKHNLAYWNIDPYLGVGLNSHSNIDHKRFSNTVNIDDYIKSLDEGKLPVVCEDYIDQKTEMEEFCILGLRKIDGIDKEEFKRRFNTNIEDIYKVQIKKHIKGGLIRNTKKYISLTKRGLDLSNLVEVDFLM